VRAKFTALVQSGPGVHSAFYTMNIVLFPELKQKVCGLKDSLSSIVEVKGKVQLYLYTTTLAFEAGYRVGFIIYLRFQFDQEIGQNLEGRNSSK
jgi:hypothetical protein